MSLKTVSRSITSKVGRQILTVQKHSPAMLFGIGAIGMTATAVLACRATLKLSEVLDEGENDVVSVTKETEEDDSEAIKKAQISVRLNLAIKIAKLYAPAVAVGVVSLAAVTGSHVILTRRNAALTAAYTIVDQSFKEYRGRVIKDQGKEKDLEYRFGVTEREIVEEGPNGPEITIVKGLDQEKIKNSPEWLYARVFDPSNDNWSNLPNNNQFFINMVQNQANDMLWAKGYVFLNDVYDLLGMDRTVAGQQVGWIRKPAPGEGDGRIDFGVWNDGVYRGKEWINGERDAILLDFNVDGIILDSLSEV